MFGLLVLLFTVVPALEIYLLIKIGSQLGGVNTVAIVVITGVVGAALAKSQGLAIINKMQRDLSQGMLPANQIIHGLLVFGGGLLLLTPGFLTDIFGLSMVIPGTRHILVELIKSQIEKGIKNGNIFFTSNTSFSTDYTVKDHEKDQDEKMADIIEVDFTEKKNKND